MSMKRSLARSARTLQDLTHAQRRLEPTYGSQHLVDAQPSSYIAAAHAAGAAEEMAGDVENTRQYLTTDDN
jgi:hypothetical protein